MEATTNKSAGQGKQKTVSITRTFNQPVNTVWKALTEPEYFKKWWGPNGYSCTECKIDLRVGGKTLANMKSDKGEETWSTQTFVEIIPMKRIVYEDNFADSMGNVVPPSYYKMPGEWSNVLVTIELEDLDGKTKMTMNQEGIPTEMYDDCVQGWQQCFDKLEKITL